jgi:hypothetical protein
MTMNTPQDRRLLAEDADQIDVLLRASAISAARRGSCQSAATGASSRSRRTIR